MYEEILPEFQDIYRTPYSNLGYLLYLPSEKQWLLEIDEEEYIFIDDPNTPPEGIDKDLFKIGYECIKSFIEKSVDNFLSEKV